MIRQVSALACFGILVAACSDEAVRRDIPRASHGPSPEKIEGVESTLFSGPGLVCGFAFAIDLPEDEELTRYDRQMDFVTYRLSGPTGAAVIYEGNAPQEAQVIIDTGKRFPSTIALHLDAGGYNRTLAQRVLTRRKMPVACAELSAE